LVIFQKTRLAGEVNIYGRKLVTRPSRCKDLFCGKGFTIACECCCCCQLDELLTEFMAGTEGKNAGRLNHGRPFWDLAKVGDFFLVFWGILGSNMTSDKTDV
jgi:hypothetical protein